MNCPYCGIEPFQTDQGTWPCGSTKTWKSLACFERVNQQLSKCIFNQVVKTQSLESQVDELNIKLNIANARIKALEIYVWRLEDAGEALYSKKPRSFDDWSSAMESKP